MSKKVKPVDGLGSYEIGKIRSAIRLVWQRSKARKLCVARCIDVDGFFKCELCNIKTPKIKIDHITQVGDVDAGFIERLFCPSTELQGLCNECHKIKTKQERATNKKPRKPGTI